MSLQRRGRSVPFVRLMPTSRFTHELTGKRQKADSYATHIKTSYPGFNKYDFLKSFAFRDRKTATTVEQALAGLGF